jgi:hypothetical protein
MNNKKLTIGITIIILVIIFIFISFTFLNLDYFCYDGQGTTAYVPKLVLLNNLYLADANQITELTLHYNPLSLFKGYVAITSTDRCGNRSNYIIIENNEEVKVTKENFDKFIANYNIQCENCLFKIHQSGNSPIFITEIYSDKSFEINNESGTLILTEFIPENEFEDCGDIEVTEKLYINDCFANALSVCSPAKFLQIYDDKKVEIVVLGDDSAFCSINYTYTYNDGSDGKFVKCNLPTYGDLFLEKNGLEIYQMCESNNKLILDKIK